MTRKEKILITLFALLLAVAVGTVGSGLGGLFLLASAGVAAGFVLVR